MKNCNHCLLLNITRPMDYMGDRFLCYVIFSIGMLSFLYIFRELFSIIYHYVLCISVLRVGSSIKPLLCSSVVDQTQLSTYRRNSKNYALHT